jgi:hypothetical protein
MARSRRAIEIRRIRSWLTVSAALALIPWIVYLGYTLPQSYVAQNWRATWVGFDILLLIFMSATAVLGFRRHHLLTLFAFTTGVLLTCDAWFDVMTARRGDVVVSVLTAAFGELPLAAVLIGGTLRIARLQVPPFAHRFSWYDFVPGVRPPVTPVGAPRRASHTDSN